MKTHRAPDIETHQFQHMVTSSPKMLAFFELIKRVARTDSAVLIRGETGTGKELAAGAIHNLSARRPHAFHAVNCAMLTPELATSELFGHVKGAFTGATSDHKGYFEASHRGTLFLDEIAELPLSAQSRLLRVLQEKTFTKMGSTKAIAVDVRILSATHKALRLETKKGSFREDLMYRLRVVPLFLPRLVERGQDIELLCWRFINEFNSRGGRQVDAVADDARNAMLDYDWPGNIRELRNNIEYAFAIGEGDVLTLDELTPELRGESPPGDDPDGLDFDQSERTRILKALNAAAGHKGRAAETLGIDRSTLWRKMKSLGIH